MRTFPHQARDTTSKDIDGISDLVVWAPIKDGFIDAFSNVTYETRLRVVAEALHNVRKSAREHEKLEPFSDTAKRILSLLDFRIGVVDRDIFDAEGPAPNNPFGARPRKYMYLVATFDGPWEPYMRLIWHPLGAFLDLVLCNCEGYKPATENDFETYAQWVRDHQLDSAIFYSTSGLTVKDKLYLVELEKLQRFESAEDSFDKIARLISKDPDYVARKVRENPANLVETMRLSFEALNVLYKLTDYYPGDALCEKQDGRYLLRATKSLLGNHEFKNPGLLPPDTWDQLERAFAAELGWYRNEVGESDIYVKHGDPIDRTEIQKGLLTSYDEVRPGEPNEIVVSHGALILVRVDNPKLAKKFLRFFDWSWEGKKHGTCPSKNPFWETIFSNIAFTFSGLQRLGVEEDVLREFPKEFRQGMSERAPVLGDEFENHPRRWNLPKRNWPLPKRGEKNRPPIELSEVDFIIQARSGTFLSQTFENEFRRFGETASALLEIPEPINPIEDEVERRFVDQFVLSQSDFDGARPLDEGQDDNDSLGAFDWLFEFFLEETKTTPDPKLKIETPLDIVILFVEYLGRKFGFTILGLEEMFRPDSKNAVLDNLTSQANLPTSKDHFGFRDGLSQPIIDEAYHEDLPVSNVRPGDLLYGHMNTRGDGYLERNKTKLMFNGSFLAVRKIAQDVETFREFECKYRNIGLAEKMIGRDADGKPLVDPNIGTNEFLYEDDPEAELCPFSAHIRLANPRGYFHGRKDPMILRRGMSYGNRVDSDLKAPEDQDEERGVLFMAYCASLAEQYEVVQRWLNAGNSTNVYSGHNDPLTGTLPRDGERTFRFLDKNGVVQQVRMDKPFTTLEWGHYFFVPSRTALETITKPDADTSTVTSSESAETPSKKQNVVPDWRVESGDAIIRQIEVLPKVRQQEEWKRILEDFLTKDPTEHDITPRIWEAIQQKRGGSYRIEAGVSFNEGTIRDEQPVVLVTDYDEIYKVLQNRCDPGRLGEVHHKPPFSSIEQDTRIGARDSFGRIFVAMDAPCPHSTKPPYKESDYYKESSVTNPYIIQQKHSESFQIGFDSGTNALKASKALAQTLGSDQFKLELGRQYIQPALAAWCSVYFGIPDEGNEFFGTGAWNWDNDRKKPVCPGDFLSTSRHTFYPRPNKSITEYGLRHGKAIRTAVDDYIEAHWGSEEFLAGKIAKPMHKVARAAALKAGTSAAVDWQKNMLARNLVGIMIGAVPPMDANLRWTVFDWLEDESLWRHQDRYLKGVAKIGDYEAAKNALEEPLSRAMCMRPAPDLIYRTVESGPVRIGDSVDAETGDLVILCLPAAMQKLVRDGDPDVALVFGGDRRTQSGGPPKPNHPLHACPAQDMAMGGMMGILAALLDFGRIQALPASLIVRISDWS